VDRLISESVNQVVFCPDSQIHRSADKLLVIFVKFSLRIIQFFITIAPIVLIGWLVNVNFVPDGILEKRFDFSAPSPYADFLVPQQRVTGVLREAGESFQQIIQDPVYFHVHLPSSFDELIVGMKFKPDEQTLLEFGPMITEAAWQYDLRPLWSDVIEHLSWPYVESNGLKLYQRRANYSSVQDFFNNMPAIEEVAIYNYSLKTNYQISDYTPRDEYREHEIYLRGYHQLLTYVGDEALDFTFWFQDMNRGEGADPIVINLYRDSTMVDSLIIPDGEIWRNVHEGSPVREIEFKKNFLQPGVYKIELNVPADIFVRKIRTKQQKLVVVNTVFLGDEVGYKDTERPTQLWTNSNYIVAETFHADGTQELRTNGELMPVSESHKEFYREFVISSELNTVYSPQGDIKITGNGLFAWDEDLYFNPYPIKLDANSDLDQLGINYLLTEYRNAAEIGDWYYNEQTFDLKEVPAPGGTIKFSVSAPGVARRQALPAIAQIDLKFQRQAITLENWYEIIRLYFSKATAKLFQVPRI
jgi:hypothetical protein